MAGRNDRIALGLAAAQCLDAIGNGVVPRRYIDAHLDHLGVPRRLRPVLPAIKVGSSAALVVGLRFPRLGAMAAAGLVGYYAAAVGFHVHAKDHPLVAAPAAAFGAGAVAALARVYLPAVTRQPPGTASTAMRTTRTRPRHAVIEDVGAVGA